MPDNEGLKSLDSTDVIKLLTEDIQSHRDYIHRLYRSAFTVGAVLIAMCVGLGYWILGKQLDAKVFEYRVVESLKKRADDISKEIIDGAKLGAQNQVSLFIEEQIENKASEKLQSKIDQLNMDSLPDLYAKVSLPKGAVISFNRASGCPEGWGEFAPAYGRFIRGIDKTGQGIDPDGKRNPGSTQNDTFGKHSHEHYIIGWGAGNSDPGHGRADGNSPANKWSSQTNVTGGEETRPKNVALLYCEKK